MTAEPPCLRLWWTQFPLVASFVKSLQAAIAYTHVTYTHVVCKMNTYKLLNCYTTQTSLWKTQFQSQWILWKEKIINFPTIIAHHIIYHKKLQPSVIKWTVQSCWNPHKKQSMVLYFCDHFMGSLIVSLQNISRHYYCCPDTPTKVSTSRAELSECATPSVDPAWMQHALFVATVATHEFFCLWWWPQPEWHTFPVLLQSIFCQHITRGNANTFVWHTATCEGIGKKWDIFYVVHALEMWPELKMNRSKHTVRFSSIRR